MISFQPFQQLFHLGFVVQDVSAAAAGLSQVFGVNWTPVEDREMELTGPDGPQRVPMQICYSREGPVHLELIKEVPGTHWQAPDGVLTPHHMGVWCDDLPVASRDLSDRDLEMVATYPGDADEVSGFAYHRLPGGMFLELLDSGRRAGFDAWFAGGPFPGRS